MASPELPSMELPTPPQTQQQKTKRPQKSRLPRPTASSRGFHIHAGSPASARTESIGFLHLPDHIRTRIYELAIYDHDRGAVFLPRALPRKVVPGVDDVDIQFVDGDDDEEDVGYRGVDGKPVRCEAIFEDSAASGLWMQEPDLSEATFRSLGLTVDSVKLMTDEDLLFFLDDDELPLDEKSDNESSSIASDSDSDHDSLNNSDRVLDSQQNVEDYLLDLVFKDDPVHPRFEGCLCSCHQSENDQSDDEDEDSDCECGDAECRVCCDLPAHFETSRNDGKPLINVFATGEHGDEDDEEHADTFELNGMVYDPKEPAILLACKEVREQCRSIYYARNSFSWRFSWTDYARSCLRFKSWLKSVPMTDLPLLMKITFQGRHVIEEGADFSVDIDLLEEYPFFETSAYAAAEREKADADIASFINREMASYLWLMVQSSNTRPSFTVGHLCELANIFVQGMHRDAGGSMSEESFALRRILSPLF